MKQEDYRKELIICYIEQFGYDVIIGLCHGLNLETNLVLDTISKEVKLNCVKD